MRKVPNNAEKMMKEVSQEEDLELYRSFLKGKLYLEKSKPNNWQPLEISTPQIPPSENNEQILNPEPWIQNKQYFDPETYSTIKTEIDIKAPLETNLSPLIAKNSLFKKIILLIKKYF